MTSIQLKVIPRYTVAPIQFVSGGFFLARRDVRWELMFGSLKTQTLVTIAGVVCSVWAVLLVNGVGAQSFRPSTHNAPQEPGPFAAAATVNPAIPLPAIPNPLRGQYEDLLVPLFPLPRLARPLLPRPMLAFPMFPIPRLGRPCSASFNPCAGAAICATAADAPE